MRQFKTTSGWNLTHDDGTENAYATNNEGGDQYTYFKGFKETVFYAETKLTVTKHLNDPFPKFGIVLRNNNQQFFFFIEANTTYTSKNVGYVQRTADGSDWDWANAKSIGNIDMVYKDGEYVTMGISKTGNVLSLYINGNIVTTATNISGFSTNDSVVVGILSFTTAISIKDYSIRKDV